MLIVTMHMSIRVVLILPVYLRQVCGTVEAVDIQESTESISLIAKYVDLLTN